MEDWNIGNILESNLSVKEVEVLQNLLTHIINSKYKQDIAHSKSLQLLDKYIEE